MGELTKESGTGGPPVVADFDELSRGVCRNIARYSGQFHLSAATACNSLAHGSLRSNLF